MSVTIGQGKKISLEEFVRVTFYSQTVVLAGSEAAPSKTTSAVTNWADSVGRDNFAARTVCRAGLLCRASSYAQVRGVNQTVVQFLVTLLNANVIPAFTTSENAGIELVSFLGGNGFSFAETGDNVVPASEGLALAKLAPLQLTAEEADELRAYPFLTIGLGGVLAAASTSLIRVVDCVTALSCEAVGSGVDSYDAANFEVSRPHRGQMQSASNLRLLLDGSKRIGTIAKDKRALAVSLQSAPQSTGPSRDVILAAVKSLEIEINSFESTASTAKAGTTFDGSQASLAVQNLTSALNILAGASSARTAAVSADAVPNQEVDATNDGFRKVLSLLNALGTELVTSLTALGNLEATEAAALIKKLELAEQNKAAKESDAAKGKPAGKPEVADDSNLTPEQRARAEAKRREKAEKAAQKSAAKEQKKGGAATVALGAGSTLIRAYVQKRCADGLNLQAVQSVLNPFDLGEDAFTTYCVKVLEQLNSGGKFKPKIAKGARDFGPEQMRIREQAFSAIRRVFKRHGGVEIDTPVFELRELLTGKYGEDSKLIYDLADQGGELLSLRYDLTVPFARFLAMRSVGNIKRFHIAKVYRRDQPQAARGRFREFYQCDFDIAGSFSPMVADAEVITVATEILTDLPVGKFSIKLNHRKLLDAIFELCGVPADKFRPICSAVDKLDKMSWEEVKKEMVEEKGLAPESADKIANFVLHSGKPKELWAKFTEMKLFGDHVQANAAMADLKLLFDYLEAMGSLQYVSFDMSLARGLDYYTGVIYEAVLIDGSVAVGSIAAGGRYDNLVGMFSPAGVQTPCVGVSIGIERVFAIMEKKAEELNIMQTTGIQVYIASIGASLIAERMKIAQALWQANIAAEYPHQDNPKFKKQLDEALERGIPFMVVFGSEELARGVVKVKDMRKHTEVEVPLSELAATLLAQGCGAAGAGADMEFLDALKASNATAEAAAPEPEA